LEKIMTTVELRYVSPIPVGHRVMVRYYQADAGIFTKKMKEDTYNPVVQDLDTGIVYEHVSLSVIYPMQLQVIPLEPDHGQEARRVQGRVVACRVRLLSVDGNHFQPQTTLVIDETAP
jgi:hypothetical protein